MEKIYVQRKIEVWVEDIYKVEEINDETIEAAINYELDLDSNDVLWDTQIDLGLTEVYDHNNNLLKTYE